MPVVVKLIELIFSTTPELTALLLVVFIYALQRYEGVKKVEELAWQYRRLVTLVFTSIVLSILCTFSSFLMLLDANLLAMEEIMFYLTVGLFWTVFILLLIGCLTILRGEIK